MDRLEVSLNADQAKALSIAKAFVWSEAVTVQELIAALEKFPGNLDIVIALGEDISYDECISVICESPMLYHDKRINKLMITE